jgi:hypothetical protein
MSDFPLDRASREAARADRRRAILAEAEDRAALYGLTINCGERLFAGTHPTEGPGCGNDGSNCMCRCHDPAETP